MQKVSLSILDINEEMHGYHILYKKKRVQTGKDTTGLQ